jgi:enediyne biosynthesis protein E7
MRGIAARYAFERDQIGFLRSAMAEHGDVFLLDKHRLVVTGPEPCHDVLMRTGAEFTAGLDTLRGFTPEPPEITEAWLRGRRVAAGGIGARMLAAHGQRLDRATTDTLRDLAEREVDVVAAMRTLMVRAGVDFCVGGRNPALVAAAEEASLAQLALQDTVAPGLSRLPGRAVRRARTADAAMRAAIDDCLARRAADGRPGAPLDLLDVLITAATLTPEQAARTVKRTIAGTHGIPGAALAWVVRELGARPDLQERLHSEATGDDRTPLTDAVVKEVLRLWPPIWLMSRSVRETTTVGGYQLRAGHEVLLVPYLVHRDERWWSEPDRFDPTRWLGAQPPHTRHAYLPFGAGPRVCLGARLGTAQLSLTTRRLVTGYTIELVEPSTVRPAFDSALTPAGLRARFTPRS